jgi:hypothetical protein
MTDHCGILKRFIECELLKRAPPKLNYTGRFKYKALKQTTLKINVYLTAALLRDKLKSEIIENVTVPCRNPTPTSPQCRTTRPSFIKI